MGVAAWPAVSGLLGPCTDAGVQPSPIHSAQRAAKMSHCRSLLSRPNFPITRLTSSLYCGFTSVFSLWSACSATWGQTPRAPCQLVQQGRGFFPHPHGPHPWSPHHQPETALPVLGLLPSPYPAFIMHSSKYICPCFILQARSSFSQASLSQQIPALSRNVGDITAPHSPPCNPLASPIGFSLKCIHIVPYLFISSFMVPSFFRSS